MQFGLAINNIELDKFSYELDQIDKDNESKAIGQLEFNLLNYAPLFSVENARSFAEG